MSRTNPALLSFAGQSERAKIVDLTRGFWVDAARVLPLGDSNTHGWDNSLPQDQWESYRADLWSLAASDGLWFDYVGPSAHGPSTLPDRDHYGISGITSTEVVERSNQIASAHEPDVVLLMLGTNDALREADAADTVPGEILAIIRNMAAAQSGVTFLLAPLPPITSSPNLDGVRAAINDQLPGVASQARSFGIDARYVPMPGLTPADLTDGVHLAENGHAKIAAAWYDALQASLSTGHGTFAGQRTPISGILDVQGSELGDSLRGNSGGNTLSGRGGADRLHGVGGRDHLMGGSGPDRLQGGAGADTADYSDKTAAVVVTLRGASAAAVQVGGVAEDIVAYIENLRGGTGNDVLTGDDRANQLRGGKGDDLLKGRSSDDQLNGNAGVDRLYAGGGSDRLIGGTGRDVLYGGADKLGDEFVFASTSHSTVGSSQDVIHNFTRRADAIDLRGIDARASSGADDAFLWGGKTAGAHKAWWRATSDGVHLRADVTGDRTADFAVLVMGLTGLGSGDILL